MRHAAQRIDLGDRQAVAVELDQTHMPERVGDSPLVQRIVVLETIVVQAPVTPSAHHAPLLADGFEGIVERKTVPIGVPDHPVRFARVGK